VLLYVGSETLVMGSSSLARKWRISPLIFGVTVVSIATSLPEAVTSFIAQFNGHRADISLGNAIGSNIANTGFILGLTALLVPIPIQRIVKLRESWLVLLMTLVLLVIMLFGTINSFQGTILLGAFLCYLIIQLISALRNRQEPGCSFSDASHESTMKASIKILIGVLLLVGGGYALVEGASNLARFLGFSERVIGLTIVAVGTSTPELFTSVIAAFKKQHEIALGNILGSNFFNLSFIVGGSSLIFPLNFSQPLLTFDMPVLLGFTLFLCYILQVKERVGRLSGLTLLLGYLGYVAYLVYLTGRV
jgi:cation:H+ antiporter